MGKEAVQKESWLTGEELADWRARGLPPAPASPHPPARAVLTAPRQQVARPTPPQCRRAGHRRSWARPFLDARGPHCLGSSALAGGLGFLVYLKMMIVVFIKAPVFAKEMGKPFSLKQGRAF